MSKYTEQLHQFESWIDYVNSLTDLPPEKQLQPLGEGKWAVRDVIAHMVKWDEFFWEHAIRAIAQHQPLTYHSLDYNVFNQEAMGICSRMEWKQLLEETIQIRRKLVKAVSDIDESQYEITHHDADGNPFTIHAYLEDFIHHDAHHRRQMDQVLNV
ncbi:hypothetical protein SD71_12300 [Cohnella kolymensis]|uniref:DinB-like domain-containing protein n=1 Tax=Cohnella kolymensis TaxID=1590652 RepID=A0ABR5A4V2_9BACL|nr:DinB family protein [Cohnella kolymensis]KIL35673.1 hypothetical protein SD71_12300 [Cohnella kolymensis]